MKSMKKCVPSCMKKKSEEDVLKKTAAAGLKTEEQKICPQCKTAQSVAKDATVFVCVSCHSVNRIGEIVNEGTKQNFSSSHNTSPVINSSQDEYVLKRVNSSTFAQLSDSVDMSVSTSTPIVTSVGGGPTPTIGLCSVCMDGPGDMIFFKCNHGGFCEPCARHIAQNMAVGGSHCPRCRQPIEALVRIVEMRNDVVKAVSVEVQAGNSTTAKQPPKVPPPRGYNKAKKQ